ncbi:MULTISPECIES: helix-turn-helix domain-containing protein [unclassified Nocardia]|uniref:helix-turn-helix domain-containing protein n=1 Tax=unclassified Nocardia TaxID=2637762 RepID=UPI0034549080
MGLEHPSDDIDRAIGNELRAARARCGLTRQQLADTSGVAPSTIQRFENGERSPDIRQLFALCDALNTSPQELIAQAIEFLKRPRQ